MRSVFMAPDNCVIMALQCICFFCAEIRKQYFLNENKTVPYLELCDLSDIRRYIITYCISNISFSNNRIYYVHSPISKYTGAEVNANTCCVNSSANSILKYFSYFSQKTGSGDNLHGMSKAYFLGKM